MCERVSWMSVLKTETVSEKCGGKQKGKTSKMDCTTETSIYSKIDSTRDVGSKYSGPKNFKSFTFKLRHDQSNRRIQSKVSLKPSVIMDAKAAGYMAC